MKKLIALSCLVLSCSIAAQDSEKSETTTEQITKKKSDKLELPVISISGYVKESGPSVELGSYFRTTTLQQIYKSFQSILKNADIKNVALYLGPTFIGSAGQNELSSQINELRSKGIKVHVFLQEPSQFTYTIAAGCDSISLAPNSKIFFFGVPLGVMLIKGYLERMGIDVTIYKAGDYKGAGEPYTEKYDISKYLREELDQVGDDLYMSYHKRIAAAKNMSIEKVKQLFDKTIISTEEALELKLVDKIQTRDEWLKSIENELTKGTGAQVKTKEYIKSDMEFNLSDLFGMIFAGTGQGDTLKSGKDKSKIAILYADGAIVDSEGSTPIPGIIYAESFCKTIQKIEEDENIKGVVLRVNSPGGSATASEVIWQKLKKLDSVKPVIVSMAGVAASGGYYISCGGRKIVAESDTITGSIGVFGAHVIRNYAYGYAGVKLIHLGKGKGVELFNDNQPLSKEMENLITKEIKDIYKQFKGRVSDARNISTDEVEKIAQGRIYTGKTAKEKGLVDEIGGLSRAIELAAEASGIKDKDFGIISYPKHPSFGFAMGGMHGMKNRANSEITGFESELKNLELLFLNKRTPINILMVMPYLLEIK
ncbi:MAG: signal peptide peptidase SppA [Planctomycetes bacterium]|nr:signal peptide peptidase SppA [Planctomycetota bacterium]